MVMIVFIASSVSGTIVVIFVIVVISAAIIFIAYHSACGSILASHLAPVTTLPVH